MRPSLKPGARPSLRTAAMAQPDGMRSYGDNPKSLNTSTVDQVFQGEASSWSPNTSSTFRKEYDPEEDYAHNQNKKSSVLAKVKEKAKKLRHTLSHKKRHDEGDNSTPSWGVRLKDYEDEEEDPEYLGAPMYESELAPEGLKENARQHPRADPVINETHVLPCPDRQEEKEKPVGPNKTLTETVTQKLAPAYATMSDVTHAITSKIQGLTVSPQAPPETDKHAYPGTDELTGPERNRHAASETNKPATVEITHSGSGEQVWDKGVSVKEYIMNKFEPGEDEKALSQVISQGMSPKQSSSDGGLVDKVKEAVTYLLGSEDPEHPSFVPATKSSMSTAPSPISTSAHDVAEEENRVRILQAN